jgi:hypothetical protein
MKDYKWMTTVILITIILFVGSVSPADSGNTLLIEPKSKDFGVLDEGIPAELLVILTNTGDRDVNITNIRTN